MFPSPTEKCEFFSSKADHRAKNLRGENSDTTCGVAHVAAVIPYPLTYYSNQKSFSMWFI